MFPFLRGLKHLWKTPSDKQDLYLLLVKTKACCLLCLDVPGWDPVLPFYLGVTHHVQLWRPTGAKWLLSFFCLCQKACLPNLYSVGFQSFGEETKKNKIRPVLSSSSSSHTHTHTFTQDFIYSTTFYSFVSCEAVDFGTCSSWSKYTAAFLLLTTVKIVGRCSVQEVSLSFSSLSWFYSSLSDPYGLFSLV